VFWRLPRDIMARQLAKGSLKCNGTVDNDVNGRRAFPSRGKLFYKMYARDARSLSLSLSFSPRPSFPPPSLSLSFRVVGMKGMKAEEKSGRRARVTISKGDRSGGLSRAPKGGIGRHRCVMFKNSGNLLDPPRRARTPIVPFGGHPEDSCN
jgi:hypothetical protein